MQWKPWRQAIGPKSPAGKAAVAQNAWTGGELVKARQLIKELNQALRKQRAWLTD